MEGSDRRTLDKDSSQAPGLASCLHWSFDVLRDTGASATVTVHQFARI